MKNGRSTTNPYRKDLELQLGKIADVNSLDLCRSTFRAQINAKVLVQILSLAR